MKQNQLFFVGLVIAFLTLLPVQAAEIDSTKTLAPRYDKELELEKSTAALLAKAQYSHNLKCKRSKENLARPELELVKYYLLTLNTKEVMKALAQLQKRPELAALVIDLTAFNGHSILAKAIALETAWPLWQILQSANLMNPDKVRERVNGMGKFAGNKAKSLLELAIKKGKFNEAQILLHFGANPHVPVKVLNSLKTKKQFAFFALLAIYDADFYEHTYHPCFDELAFIARKYKNLAIEVSFRLHSMNWDGQGSNLADILKHF